MVHTTFLTDLNPFFEGDRSPEYGHYFTLPFKKIICQVIKDAYSPFSERTVPSESVITNKGNNG